MYLPLAAVTALMVCAPAQKLSTTVNVRPTVSSSTYTSWLSCSLGYKQYASCHPATPLATSTDAVFMQSPVTIPFDQSLRPFNEITALDHQNPNALGVGPTQARHPRALCRLTNSAGSSYEKQSHQSYYEGSTHSPKGLFSSIGQV